MHVDCVPLTSFVHGDINAHEGRTIAIQEALAGDLERAGLVRIKFAQILPVVVAPPIAAGPDAGKALAAGVAQPSSALPAAPVSRPTTLHLPNRGGQKGKLAAR